MNVRVHAVDTFAVKVSPQPSKSLQGALTCGLRRELKICLKSPSEGLDLVWRRD